MVELRTVNAAVVGSSPTVSAILGRSLLNYRKTDGAQESLSVNDATFRTASDWNAHDGFWPFLKISSLFYTKTPSIHTKSAQKTKIRMLPFLKPTKAASVVTANTNPDGGFDSQGPEDEMDPGLMAAAEDLIRAVHGKDATAVAHALQAAFDISDSMPHEEGPHE